MSDKVPRLVANVDVRQLKLDAMDGFLLTRIDGRLGPKDLARETGLPDFSVERALDKLEKLGVIERVDPNAPTAPPKPAAPARDRTQLPQFASIGLEQKYDPKELEEDIELSADQKKRVLDLYYRLDDLDHYTLLGVGRDADKKTVKRAYFELASVMHPDRYFKKNLGSYKGKMEQLFGRVTEAHDTLVDPAKRVEYDAYLDEVATTRGMEAMFERALDETRRAAANVPSEPARAPSAAPAAAPEPSPSVPPPIVTPAPGLSAAELQARREVLAKRLVGGHKSVRPTAPSRPPVDAANPYGYANSADAVDALKRRYEDRVNNATASQARKYMKAAEDALLRNDVVAAASSLHIASKFAPDDAAVAMRYQEVKGQSDHLLCDSYIKQATYEEKGEHWAEAGRSWQKVAKIQVTDWQAHERAAYCILRADGDLHQAAEHAKQATVGDPSQIAYHVTLAEVYAKAGLSASAKRAAEAGLALDPKNAALLAIAKKTTKT